jgi:hypothetical protein
MSGACQGRVIAAGLGEDSSGAGVQDEIDGFYETFRELLGRNTPEQALKHLMRFRLTPEEVEAIRQRHESESLRIREMREPHSVVLDGLATWYTGPSPRDPCWPALAKRLEKRGIIDDPFLKIDKASSKVVSLLRHPREPEFTTRGLVVGHVQSGKTTNFTAVAAKAADSGYRLFIVLAGIHNGLRRQTQLRLVDDLVKPNPSLWHQLTDADFDFTPPANPASYFAKSSEQHILCVVKKNTTVLKKFNKWLGQASEYLRDCPTLVIDDEADQATVATKSINPLIREMLGRLPKAAYLGYTASPFANLLIDPAVDDDLYPRDFVVNLPQPPTPPYFGTEVVFGRDPIDGDEPDDGYDMVRGIPDDEVPLLRPLKRTDVEGFEPTITQTLRTAVLYFILATAARRTRGGGNPHSTMLVHTSVSKSVHAGFKQPLLTLLDRTRNRLDAADENLVAELEALWVKETGRVPAREFDEREVTFAELREHVQPVLRACRVILDNSVSKDRLDYENGPVVAIAVGGNTLSRGLTLEGLIVSYFVRATTAYDTLLQMGRWFGYRSGYADLPRIWMTDELRDWFHHLATVENEMRRDVDLYMIENKTPLQFAVRIRTHPSLRVTAAAKMRDAVPASSAFGGQRVQTRYFKASDAAWLENNQRAGRRLVRVALDRGAHLEHDEKRDRYILRGVPHDVILAFLGEYSFHEKSVECDAVLLSKYIRRRVAKGALRTWNMALIGKAGSDDNGTFEYAPGVIVNRVVRAKLETSPADAADIKTLMSRRDALADLEVNAPSEMDEKQIKAERLRQAPEVGLLTLYAIEATSASTRELRTALSAVDDVIGVGLVFPSPEGDDDAVEWNYVSADLSGIEIEEDDLTDLESEETR